MSFRLRKDARTWFKHLRPSQLALDFDIYYFCVMAGLATNRKVEVRTEETADLVDNFPEAYREKGRVLTALFLSRELRALSINLSERKAVHGAIHLLIDPLSPSHLSDRGMREFNKYAAGGYETLVEWFEDQPRVLSTFLQLYKRRLDVALNQ